MIKPTDIEKYKKSVSELFNAKPFNRKVGKIKIDCRIADVYYCIIFPFWKFKEASVDEDYLDDLFSNLRSQIKRNSGNKFYIIAPHNWINFLSNYFEIENVEFHFLKVPTNEMKSLLLKIL